VTYNEVIAGSRDDGPCPSQIRLSCKVVCLNNPVSFEPGDHPGVLSENIDVMVSFHLHLQRFHPLKSFYLTSIWIGHQKLIYKN